MKLDPQQKVQRVLNNSAEDACGIIGDAGSSGTRIYIVHGPKPEVFEVGHSKGGLAKLGVEKAMTTLGPLLEIAHGHYQLLCDPTATSVPSLAILGTAGTRLLSESERESMWSDLLTRVESHPLQFNIRQLRTISGIEEGLYGSLAANVLLQKLDAALVPRGTLSGVLDLGGASTQIALPKFTGARKSVSVDDFFINSYLGYGLDEIWKRLKNEKDMGDKCNFGTQSAGCREYIRRGFEELKTACAAPSSCAGQDIDTTQRLSAETDDFVLVSAYVYVMKFGHWLLPEVDLSKKASLSDIQGWADKACAMSEDDVKAKYKAAHPADVRHTDEETLPKRCFHMQYIPVLLEDALGIEQHREVFTFSNEVDGSSIDWPLGAFLYLHQHPDAVEGSGIIKGRWNSWVWVCWFVIFAALCFLWSKRPGRNLQYKAEKTSEVPIGNSII